MTSFIIRVELQGAQESHYTNLAQKLSQSGVGDVIIDGNGIAWKLPPAEYVYVGDETIEAVRNAIKNIANMVITPNVVLVTQASEISWDGLQQIRKSA
jgi:hypothetical protein